MSVGSIKLLFAIAGIYDFVIGIIFLFFGSRLYEATGVPEPNHWGYVQFGSLLVAVFGAMFFAVARQPFANRNLIPYGMMLKVSYVAVVGYYWATIGVPTLFLPFALIDAIMFVLFVMAYNTLKTGQRPA